MNGADWIIIAIVVISCLIGVWRGFMREAISLALADVEENGENSALVRRLSGE